jgi:hypothetical protein
MPTNIGADGGAFNTLIPQIDENADVQTALRTYHYGEGNSGLGDLNPNSMAGFLQALTSGKIDKTPSIIPLNANLNNYTVSGFYSQNTNAKAQSGSNYPEIPAGSSLRYAGLLRVVNDGANTYQEYQVSGIPTNPVYWRSFFGNLGWTPWQTFAFETHTHSQYLTRVEADNTYLPAIKYLPVRQPSILSNSYTLVFADESSLLLIDNGSLPNTVTIPTNTSVPFVNGTQITVMQSNTGQTTIAGASGVTVRFTPSNRLRAIWSASSLIKIGTNEWVLVGDLS